MAGQVLLSVCLISLPAVAPLHGQASGENGVEACLQRLRSYAGGVRSAGAPLELEVTKGGRKGALLYLPAVHTNDPSHPQFPRFEREWRRFSPTVAYFEGHRDVVAGDREEAIRRLGEGGWVRFFARVQDVPVKRLEPSPRDEISWVRGAFSDEEVQLTYLLLQASFYRDRQRLPETQIERAMAELVAGRADPALPRVIRDLEALERSFRSHWPSLSYRWSSPPSRWFDPFRSGDASGGGFTNGVMRAASTYRDRHMARTLATASRGGERVLAVVGGTHVAMQEAALRCALE